MEGMLPHEQTRYGPDCGEREDGREDTPQSIKICIASEKHASVRRQILDRPQVVPYLPNNSRCFLFVTKDFPQPVLQNILKDEGADCNSNATAGAPTSVGHGCHNSLVFLLCCGNESRYCHCQFPGICQTSEKEVNWVYDRCVQVESCCQTQRKEEADLDDNIEKIVGARSPDGYSSCNASYCCSD